MNCRMGGFWCLIVVYVCASSICAATSISGDIAGMKFTTKGNPYVVEDDIVVPEDKKAVIESGCILLFKPFTGLAVHGDLYVKGTSRERVVFTSIYDKQYNPQSQRDANPFDWNGIFVAQKAGNVKLENFVLHYSVYGVKSKRDIIIVVNGIFSKNGQFHFSIQDDIQFVQDKIPYSYNSSEAEADTPKDEGQSSGNKSARKKDPRKKKIVKFASGSLLGAVGLAGAGFGIYSTMEANSKFDKSEAAQTLVESDSYYSQYEENRQNSILGYVSAGVAIPAAAAIFLFWKVEQPEIKEPSLKVGWNSQRDVNCTLLWYF
ncbi:MAG: hypothetical protein GF398_12175 [Chitinivibrionales bacterium]|nr:hypothetical protein [Chitinivibrionales bacterium]